ncbi:hypothetical protein H2203_002388 [Taxawa tesnikishii (nom. ined.)]|nr:hypothetical protein H2203_002388 [Dothideales sp. JES 119]
MLYQLLLPIVTLVTISFSCLSSALPVQKTAVEKFSIRALTARSESGPVISTNFPDPSIIKVGTTSTDFSSWTLLTNSDGSWKDALPTLPSWVPSDNYNTWAPDVRQLDDGSFVMYFSATTTADTSKHCVGAATSKNIVGPYAAQASALICPLSSGGAIDASGFQDSNGQRYIVYKVDGNSIGHGGACGNTVSPIVGTPILLQPVASDGVTLQGSTTTLLNNNGASDDGIVEAPNIIRTSSGKYILFFSPGCFTTTNYSVSYATASNVKGPYTRRSTPLFQTGSYGLSAPGGAQVAKDGQHMVFHANNGAVRSLYTAVITVTGNTVTA